MCKLYSFLVPVRLYRIGGNEDQDSYEKRNDSADSTCAVLDAAYQGYDIGDKADDGDYPCGHDLGAVLGSAY